MEYRVLYPWRCCCTWPMIQKGIWGCQSYKWCFPENRNCSSKGHCKQHWTQSATRQTRCIRQCYTRINHSEQFLWASSWCSVHKESHSRCYHGFAYLEEPLLSNLSDPMKWWESQAAMYPRITKLMVAKPLHCGNVGSVQENILSNRTNHLREAKTQ